MAFTTPKTWAFGEILTSTDMNTYVRDNTDFLFDSVGGFDSSQTITSSNASWPVPSLKVPVVKVTVIGAGGGGGGANTANSGTNGGAGGTTTFNAGEGKTATAAGGAGGLRNRAEGTDGSTPAVPGFVSTNGGGGGVHTSVTGNQGMGGRVTVAYIDLTGVSTVNVTIGAGGTAGSNSGSGANGQVGGRGEVIVEYKAA